ncbi:MAG: class I SAM-dependent methyltransferase [Nevskia sp.]|nr:class I SAM-dependent methyltransferase [Nevskia sp.]
MARRTAAAPADANSGPRQNLLALDGGLQRPSSAYGDDYLAELSRAITQYAPNRPRTVLEWGAGNSTLHMVNHREALDIGSIYSLDSDASYLDAIRTNFPAWDGLHLHAADLIGTKLSDRDPGFNYSGLPLTFGVEFDVVFIDGRRRMECALTAAQLVRPDGVVLLHDYRRERYQIARLLFDVIEDGSQFRAMRVRREIITARSSTRSAR